MDEEFLNDFVGLKTGGTTPSVLKKTRSGESLPRVKTAASSPRSRRVTRRSASPRRRPPRLRAPSARTPAPQRRIAREAPRAASRRLPEGGGRARASAHRRQRRGHQPRACRGARARSRHRESRGARRRGPRPDPLPPRPTRDDSPATMPGLATPKDGDADGPRASAPRAERSRTTPTTRDSCPRAPRAPVRGPRAPEDDRRRVPHAERECADVPSEADARTTGDGRRGSAATSNVEGPSRRPGRCALPRLLRRRRRGRRRDRTAAGRDPRSACSATRASFVLDAESNPTPQSIPPPVFGDQGNIGEKHVLVMVGLPARGKTHMAKRLCQYLRFFHGARTQVFNVGSCRRRMMPRRRTRSSSTRRTSGAKRFASRSRARR